MKKLAVLGAGSWGTALAVVLAPNISEVKLWGHNSERVDRINLLRQNETYLPEVPFPANLSCSANIKDVIEGADALVIAIPSAYLRSALEPVAGILAPDVPLVSTTKGLEPATLLRMSELLRSVMGSENPVLALSGPSFSVEVARGLPTAVVLAGESEIARRIQHAFARPHFRLYTSDDIIGVELGGAFKNVIAIGAGLAVGMGLGHNALSALITRGLAEMTRLAVALGAKPRTMAGLAGLGDLVLTCTGELSRNRNLGVLLADQNSAREVLVHSTATTEGVRTASAAVALGRQVGVELPIAEQMQAVLESTLRPADAIRVLMDRTLKEE